MTDHQLLDDTLERQQALDPAKSFIIQAPAGSGKTELLIQRYIKLLIRVNSPEEILAITFTKKAANEMRTRIINALSRANTTNLTLEPHHQLTNSLAKQVLERDKALNWQLLTNPNRLRIMTIDSLCHSLANQLPMLAHHGAQPDILDNPDLVYQTTVRETLKLINEQPEWSDAIKHLLLHIDNNTDKVEKLLIELLKKRDQWLSFIHVNPGDESIRSQLNQQLGEVIATVINNLRKHFSSVETDEIRYLMTYATSQLTLENPSSPLCVDFADEVATIKQQHRFWYGVAHLLLTKEGEWRKQIDKRSGFPTASAFKNKEEKNAATTAKERWNALIEQLRDNTSLLQYLREITRFPDIGYSEPQLDLLQSIFNVLKLCIAQLRLDFQKQNRIDYIENAQAALFALGDADNPTDLTLALDYQIKHLLIDEFQDTSSSQYKLLEKLTLGWQPNDGRTLFIVGDPMQSIYRFREADVSIFLKLWQSGIHDLPLKPITLRNNFRSTPELIEWNNRHFKQIFPKTSDTVSGAVTYTPFYAGRPAGEDSQANLLEVQGDAGIGQKDQMIQILKQRLSTNADESIAILVRTRQHLRFILPALRKAGISYRAIDIDPLLSRQYIQDMLALTTALLMPEDKIAWLSILRAPWCGMTLADLLVIAGESRSTNIWRQMRDPNILNLLSRDGQQRLGKMIPILKHAIGQRLRVNYRDWIEHTWKLLGGPACLETQEQLDDIETYFSLLESFNYSSDAININVIKQRLERLYAKSNTENTNVQVMTVHSSKGLEFDTVILPHLEKGKKKEESQLLQWSEYPLSNQSNALVLAALTALQPEPDALYKYINHLNKDKLENELTRLLYVAITRAKKNLYLLYTPKLNKDGTASPDNSSFISKLAAAINPQQIQIMTHATANSDLQSISKKPQSIKRLTTTWQNPLQSKTTDTSSKTRNAFAYPDHLQQSIGNVVHNIFCVLSRQGTEWWQQENKNKRLDFIKRQLQHEGITQSKLLTAAEKVQLILEKALNDERGKWILLNHEQHQSELPLVYNNQGKAETLIIDRTFISDGTRWIIDYKSSAPNELTLDDFMLAQSEKYHPKMQQYAAAMSAIDDRPIQLALYFPAIPSWFVYSVKSGA